MKTKQDLADHWQFTLDSENSDLSCVPADGFPVGEWLPASVPGTIHTDLMANELLEDPYYRDNERKAHWVDKLHWLYRMQFDVREELSVMEAIELVTEGLDTVADIYLNGKAIGHAENMHVDHRFEVKQFLRDDMNELLIRFHSPTHHARSLEEKYGKLCHTNESHRLYMRKAQYSFGWDWGPVLPTSGIYRPIYLEAFNTARLSGIFVDADVDARLGKARLKVLIETEWHSHQRIDLEAKIEVAGLEKTVVVSDEQAYVYVEIEKPRLWWPAGYGEQGLYDITVTLMSGGGELDRLSSRFAIRKVELVRERDRWGESFCFRVNNLPVFCKGANWIPADNFLPRVGEMKYRKLLQAAKAANMNMIRVWGGGVYEDDVFYDICDHLGLMVWQDFMFACGAYPEHAEYKKNVASEIEHVVKRLRNHPCIVLWCGNNENEWNWYRATGISYSEMPGLAIFHEDIPAILQKQDPARPYWPSSPFGGEDPNSQAQGNRHQWDIWSNWTDFTEVVSDRGRFITEFGFQAPANVGTFENVTLQEDRHPQSEVIEFHNKQVDGQERLFRFLASHVRMPESFEDFVFKSQMLQGEALKACIEHWRRCKFRTAGTIIWQMNDCWPVTSWSLVDSALMPKAAYFYVKRAFKPILVSFASSEDSVGIWVTNDTLESHAVLLRVSALSFAGSTLFEEEQETNLSANCSFKTCELDFARLEMDRSSSYLKAELWAGDELVSSNRYFFKRFKHLNWVEPFFETEVCRESSDTTTLRLHASSFAKSVCVDIEEPGQLQDNWFDLDANAEKRIEISLLRNRELSAANIRIKSLCIQ